jgi:DNA-binding beta-propeller fold protein YncE
MKKYLFLLFAALFLFSACSKDGQPLNPEPDDIKSTGVYILNAGKMGNNDATLDYYDTETKAFYGDIFAASNKRGLGDTGQSLLVYGAKIYMAVSGSSTIEITDLAGKSLKQLEVKDNNGAPRMPRYFTNYKDKVYVTLFDGYVACIDTAEMIIQKEVRVGDNPEQLIVANHKIYVANSGGMNFPNYGKTVSVIDPTGFTVTKTLDVGENPQYLTTDSEAKTVYLIATGDYSPGSNILQRIDTQTDVVTTIEGLTASWMSMGAGDKLYIISTEYDENWNMTAKYHVYDAKAGRLAGDFITDGSTIPNPYHISADKVNGTVYIGSSDYISRGDIYVYSAAGRFMYKFPVSGINPEGVYFPVE